MGVQIGVEDGNEGPLLHAKFHSNRYNVSPLRGEKPQNRPLSKLNTDRLVLRAMQPVIKHWNTFKFFKIILFHFMMEPHLKKRRRPASADRTARRQFQATGQPMSRTRASDAMTSLLPRYEAKCVPRRCFQCGSVPLDSDIKGTELPPANILIPLERQLIALQLCR